MMHKMAVDIDNAGCMLNYSHMYVTGMSHCWLELTQVPSHFYVEPESFKYETGVQLESLRLKSTALFTILYTSAHMRVALL